MKALEVLADDLVYPESPRWHDGRLWISDVHAYRLVTVGATTDVVCEVPGRPAGSGFLPDGSLLLATALDRRLNVWDGEFRPVAEVPATGLLNDMVVGPDGRAWFGDTGFRLGVEEPRPGRIFTWTAAEGPEVAAEDVWFPNGMVITGNELVVNESTADRTSVFRIQSDGMLHRDRVLVEAGPFPDGLAMDADGSYWIALFGGGKFVHVSVGGDVLEEIDTGGRIAVACAFGEGSLYLCTAETTMADLREGRSRGYIHQLSNV
ncbi:SMP-30/gluconolactonase/LRE family protein [Kutzneria chonburiensis]|uniref:SMP-30/gluconolactonase/LRE family protein n=1 Tax=Kutzneria chonburiensis TaxID=1483604 RepID=A0ABV6MM45_9PSEU|nr:SMP-30/gluconolactonase/LRE family protein [Kutzneria chonburiensis]